MTLPKKRKTILLFGTEVEVDPSDDEFSSVKPQQEIHPKDLADEDDDDDDFHAIGGSKHTDSL